MSAEVIVFKKLSVKRAEAQFTFVYDPTVTTGAVSKST